MAMGYVKKNGAFDMGKVWKSHLELGRRIPEIPAEAPEPASEDVAAEEVIAVKGWTTVAVKGWTTVNMAGSWNRSNP